MQKDLASHAIDDEPGFRAARLLVRRQIAQLREPLQLLHQLRGPGIQFFRVGIFEGVLILRAADPAVDLHILHGLHKQRDALDVFRCLAQSVNDFAGAGQALVAWFEVDVKLAGVDGGVDRTTADKRRHTRDVRVLTDDLSQHTLAFHHGLE